MEIQRIANNEIPHCKGFHSFYNSFNLFSLEFPMAEYLTIVKVFFQMIACMMKNGFKYPGHFTTV